MQHSCIMKRLIKKTLNDENISVNKNTIFEEVHDTSTGIYASNQITILSRSVFFKNSLPEDILHKTITRRKSKLHQQERNILNILLHNYLPVRSFLFWVQPPTMPFLCCYCLSFFQLKLLNKKRMEKKEVLSN